MRAPRLLRGPVIPILYSAVVFLGTLIAPLSCQPQPSKANSGPPPLVLTHPSHEDIRSTFTHAKRSFDENQPATQSCGSVAAGFLMLAQGTDLRLNSSDPLDRNLSRILDRDGPDMRPSRDYKDFKDITIDISRRAWFLLHQHVSEAVSERVDLAWPEIERLLVEARASRNCTSSIRVLLDGAKRMDSWAMRLLNSWGHFPMSGIYEGTYGSPGSFHTCLDIEQNKFIGHAHYCSVAFRPLMPSQKDYEIVVRKEPKELRQMFEKLRYESEGRKLESDATSAAAGVTTTLAPPVAAEAPGAERKANATKTSPQRLNYRVSSTDAFTDILEHAQYHHFLHYKLGTCWPIQCSPFDVRRVAKLFARKTFLLNGPVKCYSKFEDDYEEPDPIEGAAGKTTAPGGAGPTAVGPTKLPAANGTSGTNSTGAPSVVEPKKLVISVWDKNNGIFIWKPHYTRAHKVALSIFFVVTAFIGLMTAIDLCLVRLPPLYRKFLLSLKGLPLDFYEQETPNASLYLGGAGLKHPTRPGFAMLPSSEAVPPDAFHPAAVVEDAATASARTGDDVEDLALAALAAHPPPPPSPAAAPTRSFFMSLVDDCSAVTNLSSFFQVSEGQMRNDILCLNGVRCITMIWIIMTHTMMYNDWSAFARTRAIEVALKSLLSQPLFNASYLVDTFFLMSGLLSAFTAFKHCQGKRQKFNSFAFIFGRWLRLTPQIFFVSMIFIFFPTLSSGPHWYPIVGEYSENCMQNWWINVLHVQAFYKKEEMCNFVTWWISIDFFYHFLALAVIWVILLAGHKFGSLSIAGTIGAAVLWQSVHHYDLGLPPNVFSTIPQTGAMWTKMTLGFFWTPYTHSIPFFFGFYIGYLMALKRKLIVRFLNTRRALIGWLAAVSLFAGQGYSTYWWVVGEAEYSRAVSTLFFGVCSFIWAGSLCWVIIACQHGYGGFVNWILSWKIFIVLGKSSYMIYLSHFLVLFTYFGNQNILIEPSPINMAYIVLGNIFMSTLLGIILCSVYEIPWLKMHRRLMKYV